MRRWEWCALACVAGALAVLLLWQRDLDQARLRDVAARYRAAAARQSTTTPAVQKPKARKTGGKRMSTWLVEDCGATAANGTYTESGTYGGKPAYTNGAWWIWWSAGTDWWLTDSLGSDQPTGYFGNGADLPAGTWSMAGAATPPVPTVSEYTGGASEVTTDTDPYNWAYANWWWDAPFFAAASPIAPTLATVGGTQYAVFCEPETAFGLCDLTAGQWYALEWDTAPWATWDTGQSGCLIDGGDGTVWCLSGGYDSSGAKFCCARHNLTTGARVSQQAVTLEAATITNMVDMGSGVVRFCERDGTTLRLHSYTLGAATYTELAEWAAGDWPGLPVGWTESTIRHTLYRSTGGDLYYMRRGSGGVAPYLLSPARAERLTSTPGVGGADDYETTGEYLGGLVYSAAVEDWRASVYRWEPGEAMTLRPPLCRYPCGRHWYLSDTTAGILYVAGWGYGGSNARPFVMAVQPEVIEAGFLASGAVVYVPVVADRVTAPFLASSSQVFTPTIRSVDVVVAPFLESTSRVFQPTIYGSADRAAGANTAGWVSIRVRVGPPIEEA